MAAHVDFEHLLKVGNRVDHAVAPILEGERNRSKKVRLGGKEERSKISRERTLGYPPA
jgi:hypothetical protein